MAPHLPARKGISLMEVTFAIGVVTVGLLGVIALLPLAAHQARQGDITDRSAVIGLSAVEEFDMRGFRRPDMWMVWSPIGGQNAFTPFLPGPGPANWRVLNLSNGALVSANSLTGATAPLYNNPGTLRGGMVQAFCIDSRFLNANVAELSTTGLSRFFPYYPPDYPPAQGAFVPRMTRVTLRSSPGSLFPLTFSQAERIFVSDDDLSTFLPANEDELSFINGFNEGPDGGWGVADVDDDGNGIIDDYGEAGFAGSDDTIDSRVADGHYSWMATLAPKLDLVGFDQQSGTGRVREDYTLSIVVFHKRDASMTLDDKNERVVNVAGFLSGGYGGGDVILEAVDTNQSENIFGSTRVNDWIMLSAQSYAGPVFRWYRISSADGDQARLPSLLGYNSGNPVWRRQLTLEGADWTRPEWHGATPQFRTQAVLVSGVVAVYEKTIRLESSSLWNR